MIDTMSYKEWYATLVEIMPDMLIHESEGELVIYTGLDAISIHTNELTKMEEGRETK